MDQREVCYIVSNGEARPLQRNLSPIVHKPTNEQRIVAALERLVEIGETLLLRDTFRSTAPVTQPKGKR